MRVVDKAIKTDVLVVGGGGAAAKAALEANKAGADVLMLVKGEFGKSGTTVYEMAEKAGFNAVDGCGDSEDSLEVHYNDIMEAARGLANKRLAKIVAEEAPIALKELEEIGVKFEKDNDRHYTRLGCFTSKKRTHSIKNHGIPIVRSLQREINKLDIKVKSNTRVVSLLVDKGTCFGAIGVDKEGNVFTIIAKATILATGGAGNLYKYNLNPSDITGDGFALAYRAGAELINMEFIQFGLATISPTYTLIDKWPWQFFHPRIYNREGEEFLDRYLPENISFQESIQGKAEHFPFSTIDNSKYIDIGIEKEIMLGRGTEKRGVYMSLGVISDDQLEKVPMWPFKYSWFLSKGIDLKNDVLEIGHFAHAFNGGVNINENASSTIDSLYAIGETAGGYCGADRLGGDMLAICQIFGKRAGRNAAIRSKDKTDWYWYKKDIKGIIERNLERIKRIYNKKGSINPITIKRRIQETMYNNASIIRSKDLLEKALNELKVIHQVFEKDTNVENIQEFFVALDVENLIELAGIITNSALLRKESRGSHYREDYPREKENFSYPIVTKLVLGKRQSFFEKKVFEK